MTQLKEYNNIENITSLKDIGDMIGFNYGNKYIIKTNKNHKARVLVGERDVFLRFINAEIC